MLLLTALCTAVTTFAYDFQSGDLYYNITSDNTVEVTYQKYKSTENYKGLTAATIPATVTHNGTTYSVTSIGDETFTYCYYLTSITIPNSVTSIGSAFVYCYSLTSITIPNSVTSIGGIAFYDCTSLTKTNYTGDIASWCNIQFKSSYANPISFSKNLYLNDVLVTDLVIPQGVIGVGDYVFNGCSSLTSVTIPNSVTSIGRNAFNGCSSLTSISLGNSVTSIGDYAFEGCSSLTSVTLPNSVTSIGISVFKGCSSLTSVTIPNSVTSIGDEAFRGCSALADIYCYATTPPMCETNTFRGVSKNCYIHVPAGTVRAYQLATGWSDFFYYYEIEEEEQAIQTAEQENKPSRKIIRDGQVLILRNGVTYDMMGQTL